MRRTNGAAALVALVGLVTSALAPNARLEAQGPADASGHVPSTWQLGQCMGGLTYGAPHKLALSWGGGLVRESMTNGDDQCLMVVPKVGFGAASVNVGYGRSVGSTGSGVSLTGGVIRMFGGAMGATGKRNYVGGSLHVWPLVALGGEIGYYVRMGDAAGADARRKRVVTWSAGFGF